jgi:uncharacterized protein
MEQRDVAVANDHEATVARGAVGAGPVAPSSAGPARVRPLPLHAVRLDPAGHLGAWQEINRDATLPTCIAHV